MTFRALADVVLAAVLAPRCAVCSIVLQHPLDGAVCTSCWARITRFTPPCCARCGAPLPSPRVADAHGGRCQTCTVGLAGITAARSVGPFDGALADIVHALKYGRRPSIARLLGPLVRDAAADLIPEIDVVVPVPLHPRRERERGFNQAELLAEALGLPVCLALTRRVHTGPQATTSAHVRWTNVRDAFAPGRDFRKVAGRTVALVDDVLTTGATLSAAATALRAAAPARVVALTAARAELVRPSSRPRAPLPEHPPRR
ncbi:MAG: double zinc ribbon domain-containing protein [Acidobacteriota bacterium]